MQRQYRHRLSGCVMQVPFMCPVSCLVDSSSLTFDVDTVNVYLHLSEGNTHVSSTMHQQSYPPSAKRFQGWRQLLCCQALSQCHYWQVEWTGTYVQIGVAYPSVKRSGGEVDRGFGFSSKSWSLCIHDRSIHAWHNNRSTAITDAPQDCHRVGVYLDWQGGQLSFYSVAYDTLTHLHTFYTTFTELLHPAFRVGWRGSIKLNTTGYGA